jgi:hypothetical protein
MTQGHARGQSRRGCDANADADITVVIVVVVVVVVVVVAVAAAAAAAVVVAAAAASGVVAAAQVRGYANATRPVSVTAEHSVVEGQEPQRATGSRRGR